MGAMSTGMNGQDARPALTFLGGAGTVAGQRPYPPSANALPSEPASYRTGRSGRGGSQVAGVLSAWPA